MITIAISSLPEATKEDFKQMVTSTIKYYKIMVNIYFKDEIFRQTQSFTEIFTNLVNLMINMKISAKEASTEIKEFDWLIDHIDPKLKIAYIENKPNYDYANAVNEFNQKVMAYNASR